MYLCIFCLAALAFSLAATAQAPRIFPGHSQMMQPTALRNPAPTAPTLMPLIRQIQNSALMPTGMPHHAATLVSQSPESGIIYAPYEYPYTFAPATSILEYPFDSSGVLGKIFDYLFVFKVVFLQIMHFKGYSSIITYPYAIPNP